MAKVDFLLAGVGGQGVLLASDVLAEVGLRAGYDVKKAEVHGMAQRGGSVVSHVRWSSQVHSPLIGAGETDIFLAFEKVEALRHIALLRPGGRAIINEHAIRPITVTTGAAEYPDDDRARRVVAQVTDDVYWVPGLEIAEELGNARVANVVLLGALSALLDVPPETWLEVIEERVPPRFVELNREAFRRGREVVANNGRWQVAGGR
jgi:indolepyruvate ferredoxin oxidoreductase beta subunit